jgi:hypothetical protein
MLPSEIRWNHRAKVPGRGRWVVSIHDEVGWSGTRETKKKKSEACCRQHDSSHEMPILMRTKTASISPAWSTLGPGTFICSRSLSHTHTRTHPRPARRLVSSLHAALGSTIVLASCARSDTPNESLLKSFITCTAVQARVAEMIL